MVASASPGKPHICALRKGEPLIVYVQRLPDFSSFAGRFAGATAEIARWLLDLAIGNSPMLWWPETPLEVSVAKG